MPGHLAFLRLSSWELIFSLLFSFLGRLLRGCVKELCLCVPKVPFGGSVASLGHRVAES